MRYYILSILTMVLLGTARASNTTTNESLLQKLTAVNTEWQKQPERNVITASYTVTGQATYTDWIATHLMLVEKTLRARKVASLSPGQQANRKALLDKLNGYWHSRAFPVNDYTNYKTPVFIDRTGNHCAVGYLMQQSGAEALAQQINREQQLAYVHEIKVHGVKEWADKNGFTIDELAWIQPAYQPIQPYSTVGEGTDGPVDFMASYPGKGLIIAGNFDTIDKVHCHDVGRYINGDFQCLGEGLDGEIKAVAINAKHVIVAGNIQVAFNNYPLAIFNDTVWNFIDIPNRLNAEATAVQSYGAGYVQVAISPIGTPGIQEIWTIDLANQWQKTATVTGTVYDIEPCYEGTAYVGAFNSFTAHRTGLADTVIQASNIAINTYGGGWKGITGNVSDTILVAKNLGAALYLGGACSDSAGRSKICLSRYANGNLQDMVSTTDNMGNMQILDIQDYKDGELLIAGQFNNYFNLFGTIGANLATYNIAFNRWEYLGNFNEKVLAANKLGDEWYIGGHFTNNSGQFPQANLRHIARMGTLTAIDELAGNKLQVFPNPVADLLHVRLSDNVLILQTELCDITGRKVWEDKTSAITKDVSMAAFPPGVYLLRTLTDKGWGTSKIVKE